MLIGGFQKFSLIDYPNKTCAIIFTVGCNFNCPYCYNKKLVLENEFPKLIPFDEIKAFLQKRVGLLDAVEFTGGEPLLHKDIPFYIKEIKEMGFLVKLDTNGTIPYKLSEIISFVDYIAMDIKAPLSKYTLATGVDIDTNKIKDSIQLIRKYAKDYEFRTTFIKNFINTESDLYEIGELIKGSPRYFIQRPLLSSVLNPKFPFQIHSDEELKYYKQLMEKFVKKVEIR